MPTPSVRSFTTYVDTSSNTDHPLDAPASMAAGDYVWLLTCLDIDTTTTSTGFASLLGDISVEARAGAAILRKAYDAGDGTTYTVVTLSERLAGVALAIENDGGIHAYSAAPESGIGETTIDVPAITTAINGCLILTVVFTDRQTTPHGSLTGATQITEIDVFSGGTVSVYEQAQATAGTIAADTIAMQVGNPAPATEEWWCTRIAIAPTSSGVTGEASVTLGALTGSATGEVVVAGQASVTLGALTGSAVGEVAVAAQASVSLGALTGSATGEAAVAGQASVTLGALTGSAAGSTGEPPVTGQASASLGALTSSAAGAVVVAGQASASLGALTSSATGITMIIVAVVHGSVRGVKSSGYVMGVGITGDVIGVGRTGRVYTGN